MDGAGMTAAREPREFKLGWAVAASVALHVLLVLLSYVTPMFESAEPAAAEDNAVLEFRFAPETDDTDAPEETARGDVPFETPPPLPPPSLPQEQAQPTVDEAPGEEQPSPPQEAVEPQEQTPPEAEPVDPQETTDATIPDEATEGLEEPSDVPGTEAPDAADADFAPGAETDPQEASPQQKRTLDLGSALSSFQQSIDRTRAAHPATPQGASGPQQNVFTPEQFGPPPIQGGPFGILEFSSRDYDWSEYARLIYWEILRAWYYRLYSTSAEFEKWAYNNRNWILDHSSGIEFVIERSGNVTGIQLLQASGCNPLDESALDALSEVILPQLPADFPRDQELVRARFIATGDIRFLRQSLRQGKAAGRF